MVLVVDNGWTAAKDWDAAPGPDRRSAAQRAGTAPSPSFPPPTPRPVTLLDAGEAGRIARGIETHALAGRPRRRPRRKSGALAFRRGAANSSGSATGIEDGQRQGPARRACNAMASAHACSRPTAGAGPVAADAATPAASPSPPSARKRADPLEIEVARHRRRAARRWQRPALAFKPRRGSRPTAISPCRWKCATRPRGFAIAGEDSAGAVQLLDSGGAAQRSAGIVSANADREGAAASVRRLLSGAGAVAFRRNGQGHHLPADGPACFGAVPGRCRQDHRQRCRRGEEIRRHGGVLIRFAGDAHDRRHRRSGAGAVCGRAAAIWAAPWPGTSPSIWRLSGRSSPFNGLAVPSEVTVSRQILAEPVAELSGRTWARLADGTPLVTAEAGRSGLDRVVSHHRQPQPGRHCRCRDFMWTCSSGCWRCRPARRPRSGAG